MAVSSIDIETLANEALNDDAALKGLIESLSGSSRRDRQNAAAVLGAVAKLDATRVSPCADVFVASLDMPEARTRWESLDVLTRVVAVNSRACDKAVEGAEASLFDEDSGPVRLSAMRFLCKLGATTANRSERVWPLIDEGIQCYHGDLEFTDMLQCLVEFSSGTLSDNVKKELAARMEFDAEHGKGSIKHYAETIIGNTK